MELRAQHSSSDAFMCTCDVQNQMYVSCAKHGVIKLENKGHQLVCHYVCIYSNKGCMELKAQHSSSSALLCGMCWAWGDRVIV